MSIFGSNASQQTYVKPEISHLASINYAKLPFSNGNRHSIEVKAGRMNLVDSDQGGAKKKMIHPDNRWHLNDCAKKAENKP